MKEDKNKTPVNESPGEDEQHPEESVNGADAANAAEDTESISTAALDEKAPEEAAETEKPAEPTPAEQIEMLKKQVADLKDRMMRKIAEFDTYRRRTAREKIELMSMAGSDLIEKLLPVLDDMDMLEKTDLENASRETLLEGLKLIHRKLLDTLNKEGLEVLESVGKPFDPNVHDALTVMNDPGQEPGTILIEHQKGYQLGERIIRHAKVVVNGEQS